MSLGISPEGVIRERLMYYHQILHADSNDKKDAFLKPTDKLMLEEPGKTKLRTNTEGIKFLYQNAFVKHLSQSIIHDDIELLIGGSTAIAAVLKNDKILPNDIDMYVKNCTFHKIASVDRIIHNFYKNLNIIMIRNPVNITWIIYDHKNVIIQQIQLVILQIKSWSEIFITYHSDLTCIGFDLKSTQFLYLTRRWERILNPTQIHYFSNIVNLDTPSSLRRATEKYNSRGFTCQVVDITFRNAGQYAYGTYLSDPNNIRDRRRIPRLDHPVLTFILEKYQGIHNICFSDRISDLFNDSQPPLPVLNMADLGHNLLTIPSSIRIPCSCIIGRDLLIRDAQVKERINEIKAEQIGSSSSSSSSSSDSSSTTDSVGEPKKSYADIAKAVANKPVIEMCKRTDDNMIDKRTGKSAGGSSGKSAGGSKTSNNKLPSKSSNSSSNCNCTCPIDVDNHRVFIKSKCPHMISLSAYVFNPIYTCPVCRDSFKPQQILCPLDYVSVISKK